MRDRSAALLALLLFAVICVVGLLAQDPTAAARDRLHREGYPVAADSVPVGWKGVHD